MKKQKVIGVWSRQWNKYRWYCVSDAANQPFKNTQLYVQGVELREGNELILKAKKK